MVHMAAVRCMSFVLNWTAVLCVGLAGGIVADGSRKHRVLRWCYVREPFGQVDMKIKFVTKRRSPAWDIIVHNQPQLADIKLSMERRKHTRVK